MNNPEFADKVCEHIGCGMPAFNFSCDEVELPPVLAEDGFRYQQAEVYATHYWCRQHENFGREVDSRGRVLKVFTRTDSNFIEKTPEFYLGKSNGK